MQNQQEAIWSIILITLLMGMLGGIVNYLLNHDEKQADWQKFWTCIVVGVAAAVLVPLFLSTISSNLLENCKKENLNYFEFAGLCLVASIFSRRFIDTLGKKILREAEEAKKEAGEAKKQVQNNETTLQQVVQQVIKSLPSNLDFEEQNEKP